MMTFPILHFKHIYSGPAKTSQKGQVYKSANLQIPIYVNLQIPIYVNQICNVHFLHQRSLSFVRKLNALSFIVNLNNPLILPMPRLFLIRPKLLVPSWPGIKGGWGFHFSSQDPFSFVPTTFSSPWIREAGGSTSTRIRLHHF